MLKKVGQIFGSGTIFGSFTAVSAYAFMVFNLFSAPCFGAIGAMRRELGNNKKLFKAICFQTILAWILATLVYQIGSRLQYISLADILVALVVLLIVFFVIKNSIKRSKNGCTTCPYADNCKKK